MFSYIKSASCSKCNNSTTFACFSCFNTVPSSVIPDLCFSTLFTATFCSLNVPRKTIEKPPFPIISFLKKMICLSLDMLSVENSLRKLSQSHGHTHCLSVINTACVSPSGDGRYFTHDQISATRATCHMPPSGKSRYYYAL